MTHKKKIEEEQLNGEGDSRANGESAQPAQASFPDSPEDSLQAESLKADDLESLLEEMQDLRSSLAELEQKAEEYLDGWQRSRAEFANYKKRILREQAEVHQAARGDVIKLYLDISDDLKRALDEKPDTPDQDSWANGIEIIYQKLKARLEAEGIKPMHALGQMFDPNLHEALMQEENEQFESGTVIEVIKEGYLLGEKVLRPALVRVAA